MGFLGHIIVLFLVFKVISILFSIVALSICIPIKSILPFFKKFEIKKKTREGNDNPLQYSCLGNPMDRGAW